jgi:hypothetical protein
MYYYIYTRARAKSTHTRSSLPLVQKNDYSGNLFWPWAPKRESARVCYERHALARRTRFFFLKGFLRRKSQKKIQSSKQEEKIFYPREILYRGNNNNNNNNNDDDNNKTDERGRSSFCSARLCVCGGCVSLFARFFSSDIDPSRFRLKNN